MHISELFDIDLYYTMRDQGYIRVQRHPTELLVIANYTEKAQYDRLWNPVTLQCRGLIFDDAGTVVARPFAKFFNYGEYADVNLPHFSRAVVTEKMDGSLGILYFSGDEWAVATRGSFISDQAKHATELLHSKYGFAQQRLDTDCTYLVEIIYPSNRIVLDYGETDDLFLLDVIHTQSGSSVLDFRKQTWSGPVVDKHSFKDWRDALAVQRVNKEGFVVHFPDTELRVKIKHDEYVRLHRIITNVSTTSIWDILRAGETLATILDGVPDEFYQWVRATTTDLQGQFDWRLHEAHAEFKQVCATAGVGWEWKTGTPRIWGPLPNYARKKFAEVATTREPHLRPLLFLLLDGKSLTDAIWRQIKPQFSKPFAAQLEDAA